MSFEYSCFISYRREEQRNKFIQDFCKYLNPEAKDATNIGKVFIDTKEIKNGVPFDDKLYSSIKESCLFTLFHTQHYLHEIDNWCARELYYALKVEKARMKKLGAKEKSKFNFLLVLILNGNTSDLPKVINKRNSHSIKEFEHFGKLLKNQKSSKLIKELGKRIDEIFRIYQKYPKRNFVECCKGIPKPKVKEVITWIRKQKNLIKTTEAKKPPILIR